VAPARAQADDAAGRDFPKTLTLDEPGVDDELSLPTFQHVQQTAASAANDITFEIDKRVTDRLQLQVTGGYQIQTSAAEAPRTGWDNVALTAKQVVLDRPDSESIVTLGATRAFGRTGAAGIGAASVGSTTPTVYFGQGFGALALPALLRPFAVTGTLGYQIPDRASAAGGQHVGQVLQLDSSVQYSLRYLSPLIERAGLPRAAERIVAIVEVTYAAASGKDDSSELQQRFAAPGLIYAGAGYQLALEALLPLARSSGRGVGAIAQLNLSFETLGLGSIAKPLWH
jgi:hypothetical protein